MAMCSALQPGHADEVPDDLPGRPQLRVRRQEKDKRTRATRLGFAKVPLSFEDLIWPGERVPRPKRARRRGGRRSLRNSRRMAHPGVSFPPHWRDCSQAARGRVGDAPRYLADRAKASASGRGTGPSSRHGLSDSPMPEDRTVGHRTCPFLPGANTETPKPEKTTKGAEPPWNPQEVKR